MKHIYKILLSLAVLLFCIAIIFTFSEQPGSESHTTSRIVTEKLIRGILSVNSNKSYSNDTMISIYVNAFDHPVRKLAHVTIYLGLGFVATWLVWFNLNHDLHFKHLLMVVLLIFIVGCCDEAIQYFSGGRGSSIKDALIDTFGGAIGVYGHFIVRDLFVHIKNGIAKTRGKQKNESDIS